MVRTFTPKQCAVCWTVRAVERAHIVPARLVGRRYIPRNTFWLCATHHRLYDAGQLTSAERRLLDPWLLEAVRVFFADMDAQRYLYFQLGMLRVGPRWITLGRERASEEPGG